MNSQTKILNELFERESVLEVCRPAVETAYTLLRECYLRNGKVLVCGNGGSAADSEHIVGELMKGFFLRRPIPREDRDILISAFPKEGPVLARELQQALPAISLVSQSSLCSAVLNDLSGDMIFAQQVYGYGVPGDVLIGISTSGNAANVNQAVRVARAFGLQTIGLTGESGGRLKELCRVTIAVPHDSIPRIQEFHQMVYHTLCAMIEAEFYQNEKAAR
jgi:D-sedoheptulose 7-phosphate isomerase